MEPNKFIDLKSFVKNKLSDMRCTEILISNIFLTMKDEIHVDASLVKVARDMNRLVDSSILKNLELYLNELTLDEKRELILDILSGKFGTPTKYDYSSDY